MALKQTLQRLAEFDSAGLPVTSFYLDIDRRRHPPVKAAEVAHQLVRQVRTDSTQAPISDAARDSVDQDLDRFTRYVGTELDRPESRGLAVFSCTGASLWEAIPLPVTVASSVKVGRQARIRPLVALADDLAPYAVVMVDREKARLFLVDLGSITEIEPIVDDVPGRVRPGSYYGLADKRIERHVDDHILHHLQGVAARVAQLAEAPALSRIVVGGTPDVVPQLQRQLPPPVAERVVGTLQHLMIIARPDEVLEESLAVIAGAERREETDLVEQMVTVRAPGGRAVAGIATTLKALFLKAVYKLAVDVDLSVAGWRCVDCARLYTTAGHCPECGADGERMDDLIDEAVRQAICSGATVEVISDQTARQKLHGMGALLHFATPELEAPPRAA